MILKLKEIGEVLKTDSAREMGTILGFTIPPTLSIWALMIKFLDQATPHQPIDLQINMGDGTNLSWFDPGVGRFWRATNFHWNFWQDETFIAGNPPPATTETSIHVSGELVEGVIYRLNVQAFNKYEDTVLASPIASTTLSTKQSHEGGGTGVEGEVHVEDPPEDPPEDPGGGP